MRCSDSETEEQADKDTNAAKETLKELRDESDKAKEALTESKEMNRARQDFIIKTKRQKPQEQTDSKSITHSRCNSDHAIKD